MKLQIRHNAFRNNERFLLVYGRKNTSLKNVWLTRPIENEIVLLTNEYEKIYCNKLCLLSKCQYM